MHKTYEFLHCPTTLNKSFGDIDYIIANLGKGGYQIPPLSPLQNHHYNNKYFFSTKEDQEQEWEEGKEEECREEETVTEDVGIWGS